MMALKTPTGYRIRPLTPADQSFLREMLYQSLYVAEGAQPFARSILAQPEIARYVEGWGREGDSGFVAETEGGEPVGAVWLRLFGRDDRGFGFVNEHTPELGMAVLPEHRGRGLGTALLTHLIASAEGIYEQLSLSVSAKNPARHLYQRFGFVACGTDGDSIIMLRTVGSRR